MLIYIVLTTLVLLYICYINGLFGSISGDYMVGYRQVRDDWWSHYYFPTFNIAQPVPNYY